MVPAQLSREEQMLAFFVKETLEREGVIREERVLYPTGKEGYIYHPGDRDVIYSLAAEEMRILAYVCETYSQLSLQSLLDDVVYETEPKAGKVVEHTEAMEMIRKALREDAA